jgi:hypothetical protein
LKPNTYDPNKLIDFARITLKCKNDAALARTLSIAAPVISKIRIGRLPVGRIFLIELHELTGLPTKQLRAIAGDRRKYFRETHNVSRCEERKAA